MKNYMLVLSNKCKKCNCTCNAIRFQQNFKDWTSGDNDIDKFIQDSQLMVHEDSEISHALEWIPYDKFYDIKYIAKNNIYRANWIDGRIDKWDDETQNWKRNQNMFVTLKTLNNFNNIMSEFMNEV
jgi:hypothetical protein